MSKRALFVPADHSDAKGKLMKYSPWGLYPMFYLTPEDEVLCSACAEEERESITAGDANWENPELYCEECHERIESAYADPEES